MLDKIKLYKEIELNTSKFSKKFRYKRKFVDPKIDIETGEVIKDGYNVEHYIYNKDGISIKYIVSSKKLCVQGRLVNILENRNLVSNISDYILLTETNELSVISNLEQFKNTSYNYIKSCNHIIDKVNKKIQELIGIEVNIEEFIPTEIEVSFNIFNIINTGNYIELFNLIYVSRKNNNYKNYVLENNLSSKTSFYVKTKSSYKNNKNRLYTVNFYDKRDQLEYLKCNGIKSSNVLDESAILANNVLRLEVQLYYEELKKRNKIFKYYLDINNCIEVIIKKYKQFISRNESLNFYSYKYAKQIIEQTTKLDSKKKKSLLNYIKEKYSHNKKHSDVTVSKYNKMLENLGIHPYFIPTKWKIDYLESPINIIKRTYNI